MGLDHCSSSTEKQTKKEVKHIRNMFKNLWISNKDSMPWQALFRALCLKTVDGGRSKIPSAFHASDPETPEKEKSSATAAVEGKLQTPPRVENKGQKKRKLVTGGNAAPVPGFGKKEGAEYPFKGPEGGMAYLEKPIPELRAIMGDRMEQSRQHFHPQSSKIKAEVADDDGGNEDDSLSVSEGRAERKKRPFKRKCWKKVPTSTERQRKALGAWLAHKGLTYQQFLLRHYKVSPLRKAAVCPLGGFITFKDLLIRNEIQNTDLECKGCKLLAQEIPISKEEIEGFLEQYSQPEDEQTIQKLSLEQAGSGQSKKRRTGKKKGQDDPGPPQWQDSTLGRCKGLSQIQLHQVLLRPTCQLRDAREEFASPQESAR